MTDLRRARIAEYLNSLRSVLDELSHDDVEKTMRILEDAYDRDATIHICGNGGSWATASHWVCDMAKGTISDNARRMRMMSLGDNVPMLTAYANDLDYNHVFSEPARTFVRKGDVVILLTASGNSPNILEAATAAREAGAISVGLIGFGGGKLVAMVDHAIVVSSREYGPVEDLHLILDHILSLHLREYISRSGK